MAKFELNVKINGVEQSVKSIGELEKALAETKGQLAGVEVGTREFKFLENQAKNLDKVMKSLSGDAKALNSSLKSVDTTAKELNNSFTQTAQAATELGAGGTKVKGMNEEIKAAANSTQSLKAQLRQLLNEIQNLEPGTARFRDLTNQAAGLRETIEDANAVVNQLAGNLSERLVRGITGVVSIGVAGFQAISAGVALFGDNSEELQKTMIRLQALLNLSNAIETFVGLDQKIVEIRASFASLTTSTTVQTVAQEGANVATSAGAVATTALGTAMKALPLIAIAAAIATLVFGIYQYATASSAAKKEDAERKKVKEDLIAAQKAETSQLAKSSAGFVLLINQLKSTNSGSKERIKLIDKINLIYPTNLKNIKDEAAFQKALNLTVADYIAFKRQQFNLEKTEKNTQAELEKQDKLTQQIKEQRKIRQSLNEEILKQENLGKADPRFTDFITRLRKEQVAATEAITKFEKQIEFSNAALAKYGQTFNEIQKNISGTEEAIEAAAKAEKKREKAAAAAAENFKKIKQDQAKAQEEALKDIKDFNEQANAEELALERDRKTRTKDRRDDIEFETKVKLEDLEKQRQALEIDIKKNLRSESQKTTAITKLNADAARQVLAINASKEERIGVINREAVEREKAFLDELRLEQKILANEVVFGNNDISDQKKALLIEENQAKLEALNFDLELGRLSREDRVLTEKEKRKLLEETADLQLKLSLEILAAESFLQLSERRNKITNEKTLETQIQKFRIEEITDAEGKITKLKVSLTAEYLEEVEKQGQAAKAEAEKAAKESEITINLTRVNLNEQTEKKIGIFRKRAETQAKVDAIQTEEEIGEKRLEIAKNTILLIQQFQTLATELADGRFAAEESRLTKENEDFVKSQQEKADAVEAAYQRDLVNNNLTEDQKKERRERANKEILGLQTNTNKVLDASNLELQKKQFERNKKLNISNAIINGAQAVMQALATLPPPFSGIAIGLAAAITAAQIDTIRKQKFDGGSTGAPLQVSTPETGSATPAGSGLNQLGGGFTTFSEGATGTPGGGAGGSAQMPFAGGSQRVFVVESDITEAQMRVKVLEDNSTFG